MDQVMAGIQAEVVQNISTAQLGNVMHEIAKFKMNSEKDFDNITDKCSFWSNHGQQINVDIMNFYKPRMLYLHIPNVKLHFECYGCAKMLMIMKCQIYVPIWPVQ